MVLINAKLLFAAFALLSTVTLVSGADAVDDKPPGVEQQIGKCLYCQVGVVHAMVPDQGGIKTYRCLTDETQEGDAESEMSYTIDLPATFVNGNKAKLDTGVSRICIVGGSALRTPFGRPDSVVIPNAANIHFVANNNGKKRERRLAVTGTGNRTVLVVRVNAPSSTQALSSTALANSTFGTGGLVYNVAAQYRSCSAAKLNLAAASGYPTKITNGVMDLTLTSTVNGLNIFDLENTMTTMVKDALGVTSLGAIFSNIMFCMPTGSTYGVGGSSTWLAYAYVPGQFSYYNNGWCGQLSAVMHELGHNLGLQHSNENGNAYNDQSCMMGYSYNHVPGSPAMCFNGHKNHVLGWYNDKKIVVNPSTNGAWSGKLVGFVDYSKALISRNEYVLIVVDQLYIQYNLAEGFNFQTQEKANLVTIATAPGTDSESSMVGGLSASQSITLGLYTIQTCSLVAATSTIPKHMVISVRLSTQSFSCPTPTTQPTSTPTTQPTVLQTSLPTKQPTPTPTANPTTAQPSQQPTSHPTSSPTSVPTLRPTNDPTLLPTNDPTLTPNNDPTLPPTDIPTSTPTENPTSSPTDNPTSSPISVPTLAPTDDPTSVPTNDPTSTPTDDPTSSPTGNPTTPPTRIPTRTPTSPPTKIPSVKPTIVPTRNPTLRSTPKPTIRRTSKPK